MPIIAGIKFPVKDITTLSNVLPLSIPQGTKADKIWNVMKVEEHDMAHETFNMQFDAMFGEDCRDSGGCLHHISRGKFGIGCVCSYLAKINWCDHFPLNLVKIQLQRLITELRHICGSEVDLTSQARPSRHIAPMSKLTDGNNAAQPELAFQCKAVQDFHMHQAQEAEFLLNASSPDAASPITTSQLKCNLSASADTDTGDDERDDGGVNEQPKACKKQHIMPSTANASQTRHIVITDEDSDGGADADQVPAKYKTQNAHASLGNPADIDSNGLLMDVVVQPHLLLKFPLQKSFYSNDKSLVDEVTTLWRHLEASHSGRYRKWAESVKYESKLPGDIKKRKAAVDAATRTLDCD